MDPRTRLEAAGAPARLAAALADELAATGLAERALPLVARVIEAASPGLRDELASEDEGAALACRALAVLAASSNAFADALRREPELLLDLPDLPPPTPASLAAALEEELRGAAAGDLAAEARAIARVRRRAMLGIGFRDFVQHHPLEEVARELSDLADAVVGAAVACAEARLRRRYPELPESPIPFAVLGLGKLGGGELNYSSDIDLIFVHDERADLGAAAARVDRQTLFERLGAYVIELAAATTPEGPLYRVDLRLRPQGDEGVLCPGVRATLRYYEEQGRTWERLALIRAQAVAGDVSLGERLLDALQAFVFRRYLSAEAIADVKAMKLRIEERARAQPFRDVKIGQGGIRDIEFTVLLHQLLHGPDLLEVRVPGTLAALTALVDVDAIGADDAGRMRAAYAFLRTVEHRVQALDMRQTHAIPTDVGEQTDLAHRMGYHGADARARFFEDLDRYSDEARAALERLFHGAFRQAVGGLDGEASELVLDPNPPPDKVARVLGAYGFSNPDDAHQELLRLGRARRRFDDASPRARAALASLAPRLLRALGERPDPQAALKRFERTAATLGAKAVFFELLEREPDALDLYSRLASDSVFLNDLLVASPGLMDEVLDLLQTRERVTREQVLERARQRVAAGADRLDALAQVQKEALLVIGVRDLAGRANLVNVAEELTALAEAVLDELLALAIEGAIEREGPPPEGACLIALGLGKLGGRELGYGSDLDVVLAFAGGQDASRAREVYTRAGHRLQRLTEQSGLAALDQRLRPGGKSAPIAVNQDALCNHYGTAAETWERLAVTKVRAVAGDRGRGDELVARLLEQVYAAPPAALAADTLAMRQRLEDNARSPRDLKRARGGLLDIEFLTAYLRLAHRGEPREVRAPGVVSALHALAQAGHLAASRYGDLLTGYQFLRKVESRMRVVDGRPISEVPEDAVALRTLARRLGYIDTPREPAERAFQTELEYHRRAIRRRFVEVLGGGG